MITGLAAVVAWVAESPWLLLAEGLAIGSMGLAFGATWEEDPARRWATGRWWAARGLVVAVMLTGLPPIMGGWSLLVIVGVGASHPAGVRELVRRVQRWRDPGAAGPFTDLSDDQLARRWRYSSVAVRSSWRSPVEVLELVQERQRLLDEIERRDPEDVRLWLSGRGGRQAQDS